MSQRSDLWALIKAIWSAVRAYFKLQKDEEKQHEADSDDAKHNADVIDAGDGVHSHHPDDRP